jgi:hypothetical protein
MQVPRVPGLVTRNSGISRARKNGDGAVGLGSRHAHRLLLRLKLSTKGNLHETRIPGSYPCCRCRPLAPGRLRANPQDGQGPWSAVLRRTTRSPTARPDSTSAVRPFRWPIVTTVAFARPSLTERPPNRLPGGIMRRPAHSELRRSRTRCSSIPSAETLTKPAGSTRITRPCIGGPPQPSIRTSASNLIWTASVESKSATTSRSKGSPISRSGVPA